MSLIRSSPVALYRQVADDLIQTYVNGQGGGARLPTEAELAIHYGVSRITIRQALAHLAERGLVVRQQGKGTFVSEARIHQDLHQLTGFQDALAEHDIEFVTCLLDFGTRAAPPWVQQMLQLPSAEVCFLKRQYLVDGRPLAVTEVSLNPAFAATISRETAERHPSYALLRQFGGVTIDRAEVTIRAQQAEGDLAGLLGVPTRSATMVLERLTYASTGEPCEHTTLYLRADAYEFGLTIDGGLSLASNIRAIDPR